MAYGTMKLGIKGLEEVGKQLKKIEKSTEKVIKNTAYDMRKRAPGRVADVIRQTYNIKKGDILKSNKVEEGKASVKLKGSFGKNFRIVYQGDRLSPTHFGMTPKVPPAGRSYTLRMQVFKGKKVVIGRYKAKKKAGGPFSRQSHNILMPTRSGNYLPFQRMSADKNDLKAFRTLAIPQMVTNEKVNKEISKEVLAMMENRLEHHVNRELSKR
jgi:hypothetical protein